MYLYVINTFYLLFQNRAKGWEIVLTTNAVMYLFGGIIFLIFGSGSIQKFDDTAERISSVHNISLQNLGDSARSEQFLRDTSMDGLT